MTNTVSTRRRILLTEGAALALGTVPGLALASTDPLLADILMGVTDALQRDWLRRHYHLGYRDGRC